MYDNLDIKSRVYLEEDFENAFKQKKKLLTIYIIVFCVYLLFSVGMLIWYCTLPYKSSTISLVKLIEFCVTAVFVVFSFIYLTIKFGRSRKYCKMLTGIKVGETVSSIGSFDRYYHNVEVKDGCDFRYMIFKQWNTKKQEFFDRKVLVDAEKEFPKFTEGENVKYFTHANILVGYEEIDKGE